MTDIAKQLTNPSTSSDGSNRKRVLIVDDEDMIRTLAEKILKRAGFSTIAVSSGRDALEAMNVWGQETSLAIVDYSMSGMSGIDTIRALLKVTPHLSFIISSGHILGPEDMPPDLKIDVRFLQKPYRANQLAEIVASLIQG